MRTTRLALAALLVAAALVLIAYPVFADDVYHSKHVALAPVGDAPLLSGFVESIYANGPKVYTQESYVLNGALPNTHFWIHFLVYPDPDCTMEPIKDWYSVTIFTNAVGNGQVLGTNWGPPFSYWGLGGTIGGRWVLNEGMQATYSTQCTAIVLD